MLGLFLIPNQKLYSQNSFWKEVTERNFKAKGERDIVPEKYRLIRLNTTAIQRFLFSAPDESDRNLRRNNYILSLPMPDGTFQTFDIVASPSAEQALIDKYPQLKTYAGQGIDDPSASVRLDFVNNGFHAMIKNKQGVFFIDPYSQNDIENYISYNVNDHHSAEEFTCHFSNRMIEEHLDYESRSAGNPIGENLKTVRLAVACTGEYAAFQQSRGVEPLAAIVTTINRVNLLYETEVATRLLLIANNDKIIYTDAATDPYTNDDLNVILDENKNNLATIIGNENFDIGHVFGTKGGGLAGINVVCFASKAWGATGISNPVGDYFDVVYVGHEMGHQFGAPHTFNSCNGDGGSATAYEPGSGTSIMAYAGLCGSDNISFNTDYYFHSGSYDRIIAGGTSCANFIPTGNNPPSVQVTSPAGKTIPISTPFTLKGTGTDPDGNELWFCWDEMDLGPISPLGSPTGSAPLFRFRPPTTSPERTFPQMSDIVDNISSKSEVLPTTTREMNFRLVARDLQQGGGGVDYDSYNIQVTDAAGPFLVQEPNTAVTWIVGASTTVTWQVANTDIAPVSCNNVNILLSTDGGYTFPIILASNVPNNGSASITVPNNVGTTNRVKIAAADNIFFDISNVNFTIEEPVNPTFTISANPISQTACGLQDVMYNLELSALAGFNESVTLRIQGLPDGVTANFSNNNFVPSASLILTLGNLSSAASGDYTFTIEAISNSLTKTKEIDLSLFANIPDTPPTLLTPSNGATSVALEPSMTWASVSATSNYIIEIATSPAFGNDIVYSDTVATLNITPKLNHQTVYYWRARAMNICGEGNNSTVFAFQTEQPDCLTFSATDLPKTISAASANTITSVIPITDDFVINDVNIPNIKGTHSYVSDLSVSLVGPDGAEVLLFNNICGNNKNFDFGFDDQSPSTTFSCPVTDGKIYKAAQSLSIFNTKSSLGNWTLKLVDNYEIDGGELQAWDLEICHDPLVISLPNMINNQTLSLNSGQSGIISNNILQAEHSGSTASEIVFVLTSLVSNGTLSLNGTALSVGDRFTQEDINNNVVSYLHNASATTSDQFTFDIIANQGGWLSGNTFNISIQSNSFTVSAILDQGLNCFGDNNGQISVNASGGTAPYEYSLDGISFQSSNIFTNLSAGVYNVNVKDASGALSIAAAVTIENPDQISIVNNVEEDVITINATGGTSPFLYSIDGSTFQASNIFSNLSNNTYTITVKDSKGCTNTKNATIAVNTLAIAINELNTISCYNGSDGSLSASVTGGATPYEYSIDGSTFQAENIFDNLSAGSYTITVKDADGFTLTSVPVDLVNPSELRLTLDVIEERIEAIGQGGTGNYTYQLDNGPFQNDNTFTGLTNGTYQVTLKDSKECTTTETATVLINDIVATADIIQEVSCKGGNNGKIEVSITGGTAPFEYSIDGGENYQTSNIFENLTAGNYIVIVKDKNNFTRNTETITIIDPEIITIETTVVNDEITINASGGVGVIRFSIDGETFQGSNVFSDLASGDYIVTAKDENGCRALALVTISTTGLSEIEKRNIPLKIYPNPNAGQFTLEMDIVNNEELTLRVFDMKGQQLIQRQIQNTGTRLKTVIDITTIPKGVYNIQVTNGQYHGNKKVVILE